MSGAPRPPLALVFTDVQGSTRLWEQLGARFAEAIALHDRALLDRLEAHGGYAVKSEGDGAMLAFADAGQAVRFALDLQDTLRALPWPPMDDPEIQDLVTLDGAFTGPRVRVGVDVGSPVARPDPVTGRVDYLGPAVNRAARVAAAAHGGQVVLSARALAEAALPEGVEVVDLGAYALRGIDAPVRIHQLGAGRFPALRAPLARRTNLTPDPQRLHGRAVELAALAAHVDAGARLITVVGPGGVGKTRLTRRFGLARAEATPGGVWFCALERATDAMGVRAGVAAALSLPPQAAEDARLRAELARRERTLLILDNLEQVTGPAAAVIAGWLDAAPTLQVLASSRIPLRLPQERVLPVPPLAQDPGVALFLERAQRANPAFSLRDGELEEVAELVRRVDGLPLSIELAAARSRAMRPGQMLARMDQRFRLLAGPGQGRHATLRAVLDGSWELLGPAARRALAQLSVFRGPFTLEDAEAVLDLGDAWPSDALVELVDHSLVQAPEGAPARLSMLASVAEYAATKLEDPAREAAERRHGRRFASLAEPLPTDGPVPLLPGAEALLDDLVAAVARAARHVEPGVAARCALLALEIIQRRGPIALGPRLVEQVLGTPGLSLDLEGRLRNRRAQMLWVSGDIEAARQALTELRALYHRVGDAGGEAALVGNLGVLLRAEGRIQEAEDHFRQAVALNRRLGQRSSEAVGLRNLGTVLVERGALDEAGAVCAEALTLNQELGDVRGRAVVLGDVAVIRLLQGEGDEALRLAEVQVRLLREGGDRHYLGGALGTLAEIELTLGRAAEAQAHVAESLAMAEELGLRGAAAIQRSLLAHALAATEPTRAEALFAQADAEAREAALLPLERGLIWCRWGRCAAAWGQREQAAAMATSARAIAEALPLSPDAPLRRALDMLERGLVRC
ncbi:MAG: tetratricopeptide repeat protein [Alphaproteobacteria bacterium]|nr:tetratricopeptide repeat protein [Alphaproteobacteria bacterium]